MGTGEGLKESIWKRVSRRQLLRGAAVTGAGLAGAVLIGCGDDDDDDAGVAAAPAAPTAAQPKRGGTLTVAIAADVNTLDPALSVSTTDNSMTMQVYNNLVLRQHDGSLAPHLAESWTGNDDLSSYTFKLRQGVKFHHGKELTAEDVKFSFDRILDEATGSPARSPLDFIEEIVVVDDLTVRFDLEGPNSFAPDTLSLYQGRILPSDVDIDRIALEEFGTGPFRITDHKPNESTVFERNPDYWDEGKPYLDKVVFQYMPEIEARVEAVKSGAVDALANLDKLSAADDIEANPGTKVLDTASASYLTLAMRTDKEPFTDVRVRRAIQLATDRQLINNAVVFGRGIIAADMPIPPSDPHSSGLSAPAYNPEEAKKLLAEAGHANGIDITLHTSTVSSGMVEMAQAFKEGAAKANINVSIKQAPEDSYWSDVWLVEPFTTVTWNGRSPDQALSIVYKSDADWNESYYVNTRLDELIVKARGQDLEGRRASYKEIHEMLLEDVPRIIPIFRPILQAMRDNVQGLVPHPNNWLVLTDTWLS